MDYIISYFSFWHSHIMDADRLPKALLAVALAAILGVVTGPLAANFNPFFWLIFDKIFGRAGDKMNRVHRPENDLALRGLVLTLLALGFAFFVGKFYERMVVLSPAYGAVEVILLSTLITGGSIWYSLLQLYFALEKKQPVAGAFLAISRSTRLNLNAMDDYGTVRVGMGYTARIFDKGLVSPVFWYLIGGLPVAVIYSVLAALAWRFGKDGFSKGFGNVPVQLEKLMGMIPSILAAFIITTAGGITPTARLHKGVAAWFGHKNRAPYEQGGYPLSALAWLLNVSLGGAGQDLSGSALKGEWVGPDGASAKIDHNHLKRAIYIHFASVILFMAALCGAYLWSRL